MSQTRKPFDAVAFLELAVRTHRKFRDSAWRHYLEELAEVADWEGKLAEAIGERDEAPMAEETVVMGFKAETALGEAVAGLSPA